LQINWEIKKKTKPPHAKEVNISIEEMYRFLTVPSPHGGIERKREMGERRIECRMERAGDKFMSGFNFPATILILYSAVNRNGFYA
jgi:hypothetical protein